MHNNDEEDDYWDESVPKAKMSWDDLDQKNLLGATADSTGRLYQQLKTFDSLSLLESGQSTGGQHSEPVVPLTSLILEANIDLIVRLERPDLTEVNKKCSEETLLEEMLLGHQVSLESCKSLRAKANLVQGAVNSADGEVILMVVLHVMNTLSKKHAYKLLSDHPVAAKIFANYLSATNQHQNLINLLESIGKMRDSAILHYHLANLNHSASASRQAQNIFSISSSHFNSETSDKHLKRHMKLLEFCGTSSLSSSTTCHEWLKNALTSQTQNLENLSHSALSLGMTEKIFQWISLKQFILNGNYKEIQKTFKTSWLMGNKPKSHIPMVKLVMELEKSKAPKEEILKYVAMVEDPMERRSLEAKFSSL
ncbi:uncharacterized protein LOC132200267 [Neocloeon triangulifer]|uniref:uncharacterized protein LOC132200267 n=1 Tax=Neocloeon triangulifer TaxID=2078957 RepID=UPI00286F6813|nr:uncharacterized protein LOC132200267 [Neocloeon triangulifer]